MPIYEYRCSSCGHEKEYLQKLSDAPITICEACGKAAMTKLMSAAGFQLKGSGWYATDFKHGSKPAAKPGAAAESKSEGSGESKSEASGESKSEASGESKSDATAGSKSESGGTAKAEGTKSEAKPAPAPAGGS
ncbi:MAG: zinc ribbon domain-containing protein [Betaproteobacteria bacterium]